MRRLFLHEHLKSWAFGTTFLLAGVGCGGSTPPAEQPAAETSTEEPVTEADRALAEMYPTTRSEVSGTVVLREEQGKGLVVKGQIRGLPAGSHALAIHEEGDCSAHDAKSVGGFFNPTGSESPLGLLGDIKTTEPGQTEIDLVISNLEMSGPNSVVGRALVVHAWPYDPEVELERIPYLACGVIRPR